MRRRACLRLLVMAAASATLVLVPAALSSVASTALSAALGDWQVTLHYSLTRVSPGFSRIGSLRLRATRGGTVVYDRPVPLPSPCVRGGCTPLTFAGSRFLELRDLGGRGAGPSAVVWLWTGGAHCCTVVRVVSLPDGATAAIDFGDPGARIVTLGGIQVFLSADDRFAYLFTSYAASGFPVRVWRFGGGRFEDVTAAFPARIAADADTWWKAYVGARRTGGELRGLFSAWAADTCALGRSATVASRLAAGVARGDFAGPRAEPGGPVGRAFAAELLRDLRAWGYCR